MLAIIGIQFYFGIVSKPTIRSYWETSVLFGDEAIREIMSRDRFIYYIIAGHSIVKSKEKQVQ